jgi:hypothetical protein
LGVPALGHQELDADAGGTPTPPEYGVGEVPKLVLGQAVDGAVVDGVPKLGAPRLDP